MPEHDELGERIASVETEVAGLRGQINGTGGLRSLERSIDSMGARMTTLESDLQRISNGLGPLGDKLEALKLAAAEAKGAGTEREKTGRWYDKVSASVAAAIVVALLFIVADVIFRGRATAAAMGAPDAAALKAAVTAGVTESLKQMHVRPIPAPAPMSDGQ